MCDRTPLQIYNKAFTEKKRVFFDIVEDTINKQILASHMKKS